MTLTAWRASRPTQLKGALLVLASAACISVTFVASKQALQVLSPMAFTPIWFGVASLWGIGFYLLRNGPSLPAGLRVSTRPILLLGILNSVANLLLFTAISLGDPTVVAFFSRSETIYSVFLGALVLGERMYRYQWAGVVTAIAGTGLMTFRAGTVAWLMLIILLISTFFLSLSKLVAKKSIAVVEPLVLSIARTLLMSLILGLIGLAAGHLAWPSSKAWLWIIGGSFFGPFLSYVLFYQGLRYLDLTKSAVIRATQPLFVAVYSLILFDAFITGQQFVGGMMMLAGGVLMLWQRQP